MWPPASWGNDVEDLVAGDEAGSDDICPGSFPDKKLRICSVKLGPGPTLTLRSGTLGQGGGTVGAVAQPAESIVEIRTNSADLAVVVRDCAIYHPLPH